MLEEIKKNSNYISRKMAKAYSQMSQKVSKEFQDDHEDIDLSSIKPIIESLCKKHGITAQHGSIRSGTKTPTGQTIEFMAFTQSFWRYAPALTEFISDLSRSFIIEAQGTKVKIRSGKPSDRTDSCRAGYFVQGETTYAVDLANGQILKLSGYQKAGGGRNPDGKIAIELNIEYDIAVNDFIHELIHAKLPEEIQQYNIPHDQIDEITNEIERQLKIQMTSPISEIASLKEERLQILEIFNRFDKDLRKLGLMKVKRG